MDKEIGCRVLDLCKTAPADLHWPGFCGISVDRTESGPDSQNIAFSENSRDGTIWGLFSGLSLRSSLLLSLLNVPIGFSTEAEDAGHIYLFRKKLFVH